ncbi:MAG: hypothetical protein K8S20_13415 [Chloroflexi bacterium]|nr:hypothetical protein [Chloroflexota bacterium]
MQKRSMIGLCLMVFLGLSACDYGSEKPVFDIYGSPNPLYYGGSCPAPVLTLRVSGPGEGLRMNSIIAAYQLFDHGGNKITEATVSLKPIPDALPVSYDADRIISVPDGGGSAPAPDSPIIDFGEGRVDFAATVYAKVLSPAPGAPGETYFFTSTKSIPVLPCGLVKATSTLPAAAVFTLAPEFPSGLGKATVIPPSSYGKPTKESGSSVPSCSVEPNNPNCVP